MALVSNGAYRFLDQDHIGSLVIRDPAPGSPVIVSRGSLLPPIWQVRNEDDGTVTIWTEFQGLRMYLSCAGDPRVAAPLVYGMEPRRWDLRPGSDEDFVIIAVPARLLGPGDKDGLAVDLPQADTYPPPAMLARLDREKDTQNWFLQEHS
ncbi:hypothetical protein ABH920_001891 [Catenulispora sp. EB89]|uniref:hypothetical protein n=1 Tax=Catenulispora sp. EB89 TaxID=3156257 RepID=UPI0035131D3A